MNIYEYLCLFIEIYEYFINIFKKQSNRERFILPKTEEIKFFQKKFYRFIYFLKIKYTKSILFL